MMHDTRLSSRYLMNGAPTTCAFCGQPFPVRDGRVEAKHDGEGNYYCHDTPCENDALESMSTRRRRMTQ